MIITVLKEPSYENRVAITPQATKKYISQGFKVIIEANAGINSGFDDASYISSGAKIEKNISKILRQSDILLKVTPPTTDELKHIKKSSIIIANFQNSVTDNILKQIKLKKLNCFALEKLPRVSKAQSFDILSSQDSLSGYQSVIKATELLNRSIPMMITSAGTLAPIKFLILGIGIAGLQAIATAKRLGAKVYAHDIRPETKEQAMSLGAVFVEDLNEIITQVDVIISSAFSSGKKAPLLIKKSIIKTLKKSTVLIDMAISYGGNIEGSKPLETIDIFSCKVYADSNLANQIPQSACILYANNLSNFIDYLALKPDKKLIINKKDEIIKSTFV